MKKSEFPAALRIALTYLIFAALWILLSGRFLASQIRDKAVYARFEAYKGEAFVMLTALLLYFLLQREFAKRRNVEKTLEESQRALSNIMAHLPGMAYQCDNEENWTMRYVSDGCLVLTGYAPDDLLGNRAISYASLIHADDRQPVWDEIQAALKEKRPFKLNYRIIDKNGVEKCVWEQGQGVFDGEDQLQFLEGFITDVTERNRAQEALKFSNERLAFIARVTSAVVGDTPLAAQARQLAAQVCAMFVVDACVIRMVEDRELVLLSNVGVPEERLQERISIGWGISKQIMEGGCPVAIEDVRTHSATRSFTSPSPNTFSFISYAGAPMLTDGSVTGILGIYTNTEMRRFTAADLEHLQIVANHIAVVAHNDHLYKEVRSQNARLAREIEERLRAEQRIREQAALLDKARDAILVRDLSGRVLFWNRSAEALYGWSASEAFMQRVTDLFLPDANAFAEVHRSLLTKGDWNGEEHHVTKDGREIVVDARLTLVRDDAGLPHSVLAINNDITDRKKREVELIRTQRLESIGTLAGGIAHDLNNVLAPILMSVGLLKQIHPDSESREILETLETSGRRGAEMVAQVLSFARGVEGRRVMISCGDLVREVYKITRETFPKSIRIGQRILEGGAETVGDPTQLHQVLLNLCVNARDAMPEGGSLTMAVEEVSFEHPQVDANPPGNPGDYVCISVRDTGTGISPEVRQRIFEPFFTTKEIGKGTGLGLSTSLAIIKSHGGFLRVQSEMGQGTCFNVYLPAASAAKSVLIEPDTDIVPSGNGELILLVDDEAGIRNVARHTLESFGYRVIIAADGGEALSVFSLRRAEISAIVADMMMPGIHGFDMARAMIELEPSCRIIATSGLADDSFIARLKSIGARDFLAKPYTAEALLKALHRAMDGKHASK